MVAVYHSTPWRDGNIGAGINEFCALVPDDAWVCLRDGDSLFLHPQWGNHVRSIIEANPDHSLIGCVTNRLRADYQLHGGKFSEDADLRNHVAIAKQRWAEHKTNVAPLAAGPVAAVCMIFPKRVWQRHPFAERTIDFDRTFTDAVRAAGGRIGIAQGLYLWHTYRLGHVNPLNYIEHLKGAQS